MQVADILDFHTLPPSPYSGRGVHTGVTGLEDTRWSTGGEHHATAAKGSDREFAVSGFPQQKEAVFWRCTFPSISGCGHRPGSRWGLRHPTPGVPAQKVWGWSLRPCTASLPARHSQQRRTGPATGKPRGDLPHRRRAPVGTVRPRLSPHCPRRSPARRRWRCSAPSFRTFSFQRAANQGLLSNHSSFLNCFPTSAPWECSVPAPHFPVPLQPRRMTGDLGAPWTFLRRIKQVI